MGHYDICYEYDDLEREFKHDYKLWKEAVFAYKQVAEIPMDSFLDEKRQEILDIAELTIRRMEHKYSNVLDVFIKGKFDLNKIHDNIIYKKFASFECCN